jgi:single-stranded-DNA-specific exonuclease
VERAGRWQVRPVDPATVERVGRDLKLAPVLAHVLVARGLVDEAAIRRHLDPRLADLLPPASMAGLAQAVERVGRAVMAGELIGIFGDYDVDGVTSTALLGDFLRRCDAAITLRAARRDEGYGFGEAQAREMLDRGCRVLILADCGTSDVAAVRVVADEGVAVVAIDHHRITRWSDAWPGLALVNPQRPDCGFGYKGLCSVGLCFYFAAALRRCLEGAGRTVPDPRHYLDLVALGTVADVAPLDGLNRILVARGLQRIADTERPGLRELLRICDLEGRVPETDEIGWRIGPRLNAPGRLGDATVSLDCLYEQDAEQAVRRARQCDTINEERKEIQGRILEQALEQARPLVAQGQACLLVAGEEWHAGVIGIVASRLVDEFGRPAGVVALEGEIGRGSARSIPGLDLMELLGGAAEHLLRHGGHAAAAGFSVRRDAIDPLRQRLHEVAAPRLAALQDGVLEADGELPIERIDLALCKQLRRLAPFGNGNPEPTFIACDVRVESVRLVGRDHLALALRSDRSVLPAIGFGMRDREVAVGERLDVAFVPEIDNYLSPRVRLRLRDLWRTSGV